MFTKPCFTVPDASHPMCWGCGQLAAVCYASAWWCLTCDQLEVWRIHAHVAR